MAARARMKPTLHDLLSETKALIEDFHGLCTRFPPDPASLDNMPIRRPLGLSWRPNAGNDPIKSDMINAVCKWTERLRAHVAKLNRYFVDWLDKPDASKRFPLSGLLLESHRFQGLSNRDVLGYLNEHVELLLIHAEKNNEVLPDTLPNLLKQKRAVLGWTQSNVAGELGISLSSYKTWERGRAFPPEIKHLGIRRFLQKQTTEAKPDKEPGHN